MPTLQGRHVGLAAHHLHTPAHPCSSPFPPSCQASLGLVLATLLTWRQQAREARRIAACKARLSDEAAAEAAAELLRSPYLRVSEPVLRAAGTFGTWVVPVGCAALAAFIASLVARPGAVGP